MLLETKRLFIRPFAQADAEAMLLVFSDPEVMKFSDYGVQGLEWTKIWLTQVQTELETTGYAKYAVLEKSSGEVIGYCGFGSLENTPALGYRLKRSAWGFGYATEAAQAVLEWGFGKLRFTKVVAQVDPNNLASVRVAKRLGMVFEREVMLDGYTHPDHVYVLQKHQKAPDFVDHIRFSSVVVLDESNQVLLVCENKPGIQGLWNTPSGGDEAGELPVQAAKRELLKKQESPTLHCSFSRPCSGAARLAIF